MTLFDKKPAYWLNRDLNSIPRHLAKNIGEMHNYQLVVPEMNQMFEPLRILKDSIFNPKHLMLSLVLFHSEIPSVLSEYVEKGTETSLVLTEHVFEKMKKNFHTELDELLRLRNVNLFVWDKDITPPQIAVSEQGMLIIFFNKMGKYDYNVLLNFDESALKWGKELFMHYRDLSKPVTKI